MLSMECERRDGERAEGRESRGKEKNGASEWKLHRLSYYTYLVTDIDGIDIITVACGQA